MTRAIVVAFLVLHGFVHAAVWVSPAPAQTAPPFDPSHSWALAGVHATPITMRAASVRLAWLTAGLYVAAGVALTIDAAWWAPVAAVAASAGLVLKALWFNRWLSLGVAMDAAVIAGAVAGWPLS